MCTAVKKWIQEILTAKNTTELVVEIRPEKNSGLYRIWIHDLCTSIPEVMGSNPMWAWIFFQVLFQLLVQ